MFLIGLLHIIYGATFTISKILISYATPILVIGIRMTLAGFLLLGLACLLKKNRIKYDFYIVSNIFALGFFGIFLPYALRYWSLKYLTVLKTSLIYNLSPFISFIFSYLFLNEKTSAKKIMGMTLGFLGVIPIIVAQSSVEESIKSFLFVSWAEVAMLISVSSFCLGWVILKKLISKESISPFALNGRTMIIGGILSLMTSCIFEQNVTIKDPVNFSLWLIVIILMTNVTCFYLYSYLLKKYSATLISLGGLIAPLSAGFTSWLLLGEKITVDSLLSGILIVIGFLIFYLDEIKSIHITSEKTK